VRWWLWGLGFVIFVLFVVNMVWWFGFLAPKSHKRRKKEDGLFFVISVTFCG